MTYLANSLKLLKEDTFNNLVSATLIEQYEEKLSYMEVVLTTVDQKHDTECTLQGSTHYLRQHILYIIIKFLIFRCK